MYRVLNDYKVAIGTGFVFWTGICLLLSGCASGISRQARSQVTYKGNFRELQTQVEGYLGEVVLQGGRMLDIKRVLQAIEIKLWPRKRQLAPGLRFGFGVQTSF